MKNHNIIKLLVIIGLTCGTAVFFGLILSDPYFFTSEKKLYKTGVAKMEEGILGNPTAFKEATFYFNALLEKGHADKETYDRLYWCYRFQEDFARAEEIASEALQEYPEDIQFLFHRAESRLEQQKFEPAIEDYNKVIDSGKDFKYRYDAFYSRGAAHYMLGEKEKAEADKAFAVKIAPFELEPYEVYAQELK